MKITITNTWSYCLDFQMVKHNSYNKLWWILCPLPHFFLFIRTNQKSIMGSCSVGRYFLFFSCTGNLKRIADSFRSVTGAVIYSNTFTFVSHMSSSHARFLNVEFSSCHGQTAEFTWRMYNTVWRILNCVQLGQWIVQLFPVFNF